MDFTPDKRKNRLILNTFATGIMQLTAIITGFSVTRLILFMYNSETSGFVVSLVQICTYIATTISGINGGVVFALYGPLASGDRKEVNDILSSAKRYFGRISVCLVFVFIGISFLYPKIVKSDVVSPSEMTATVLLLGGAALFDMINTKNITMFIADQSAYVVSFASTASYLVQLTIAYVFYRIGAPASIICVVFLSAAAVRFFVCHFVLKKKYDYIDFKGTPKSDWHTLQSHVILLQALFLIQSTLPILLTTYISGLKAAGAYSIYNTVISGLQAIFSIFILGTQSSFGDIIAREESESLSESFNEIEYIYTSLVAVVYSTAIVAILPFILLYTKGVDNSAYTAPLLGVLFIVNSLFVTLQVLTQIVIQSAGKYKEACRFALVQIAILVVLSLPLGKIFGLTGILSALIIANLYRNIAQVVYTRKSIIRTKLTRSLKRQTAVIIIMAAVGVPVFVMNIGRYADSVIKWIIFSAAVVISSLFITVVYSLIFERTAVLALLKTIFKVFKKILHKL